MASIEKTDNGWRVRWIEGGKRHSQACRTKAEARNVKAEKEGRKAADGPRLDEVVERWLKKGVRRDSTLKKYRWLLDKVIYPELGPDTRIRHITVSDVSDLCFKQGNELGRSWNNARAAKALLFAVFRFALREGYATSNPADFDFKVPKPRPAPPLITTAQLVELANKVGHQWRAMVLISGYTGLRWGEVTGLVGSNVHLDRGYIDVDLAMSRTNAGLTRTETKTDKSRRRVALAPDAIDEVRGHMNRYRIGPTDLLFTDHRGRPLAPNVFWPTWERARQAVGLPGFRWHDLRHVAASHMLNRGIPIQEVSAQLGHASIQITVDLYGHLRTDHVERLQPQLAGLYDG